MLGRTAHLSHPGRKRRHNEDSYVHEPPLFAVADGMGGAKAGEIASGLAADAIRGAGADGADDEKRVVALIQEANRRVYERATEDAAVSGMGTTMTAALVDAEHGRVTIGHVGDSRAYRIRDGKLEQLTQDHSLVAELMRSGKLTPEEAEVHPQRSVITRALGTDPDVDVDTFAVDARPGDVFLLCSDGLTSMVSDDAILRVVRERRDNLDAAAKGLIAAANRGGGDDNITVVVFEIASDREQQPTRPMPAIGPREDELPESEDEDTLVGTEAPAPVGTMVVRVEDLEAQTARAAEPEPEPERKRGRRVLVLALLVAFLATIVVVALLALDLGPL
jgi:protein phosphatase